MKNIKYIQIDDQLYKIGDADRALTNVEIDIIFNEVFSEGYYGSGGYGSGSDSSTNIAEEYSVPEGSTYTAGIGDYED
jgi:hypothetical protein